MVTFYLLGSKVSLEVDGELDVIVQCGPKKGLKKDANRSGMKEEIHGQCINSKHQIDAVDQLYAAHQNINQPLTKGQALLVASVLEADWTLLHMGQDHDRQVQEILEAGKN